MFKTQSCILINAYVGVLLLIFGIVNGGSLRTLNNPLNNKAVDVYIVVDEGNSYMNEMQLGLMKTTINNLVIDLNPASSSPRFTILFYGAASTVTVAVTIATSASAVKTTLDQKQYTVAQSNPSKLQLALNTVDSQCQSYCRSGVPRVTVVLSSTPDALAETTIRQLERNRGMTVIVVGIGLNASPTVLNRLASHPTRYYAIPVMTLFELILSTQYIASVVSNVPRLIDMNTQLFVSSVPSGIYHTVQLNTYSYATTNNTIVMFASNCPGCSVYGSLSEPNPISTNTVANTRRYNFFAYSGYPNTLYYFRIPQYTSRFYLSLQGNGMASAYILFNVIPLPDMMGLSTRNLLDADFSSLIG